MLGAWGLTHAGALPTFIGVGVVQALAVIPLIGAPDVPVARAAPPDWKPDRLALGPMVGDGLFAAGSPFGRPVWPFPAPGD